MFTRGMTMRTVRLFDEQRVRLEAAESILAVQRVAAGSGAYQNGQGQALVRQWAAIADDDRQATPRPVRTREAFRSKGIRVFSPPAPAAGELEAPARELEQQRARDRDEKIRQRIFDADVRANHTTKA
jgi:hypothetical protein